MSETAGKMTVLLRFISVLVFAFAVTAAPAIAQDPPAADDSAEDDDPEPPTPPPVEDKSDEADGNKAASDDEPGDKEPGDKEPDAPPPVEDKTNGTPGEEGTPVVVAPPARERLQNSRTLNGHTFNPTDLVRDPFASTYFGLELATGFGTFESGGMESDLGSLEQRFSGQLHLMKGLSIATVFQGQSLFDADNSMSIGTSFTHRFDLRYGFDLGTSQRLAFGIDSILTTRALLEDNTEKAFGGSVQYAFGAGLFGFYADGQIGWLVDGKDAYINSGFAVSIDIPLAPIAVLGSFREDVILGDDTSLTHRYGLAVHYTGRENYVLGLEFGGLYRDEGATINQYNILFRVRYYWDADREFPPKEAE